ncbi:MAG: aldolase [Gammaproteobacteria bacterium]|nr:aldolase [Gammaproteobacteria bacterium]
MSIETSDSFSNESDADIHQQVSNDLKKHAMRENFALAELMIIATRKLAEDGHSPFLAGQITARAEQGDSFWTSDLMKNFAEVEYADLIRFDRQMDVVEGNSMPNPAVRFHLWIYENRPDIRAIIHTHPPYASALSMLEEELVVAHMDAMPIFGQCAFVADWPGVPVGNSEGELIAGALGKTNKTALLGHHGIIATGRSLSEALYLAITLENAARLQMTAQAAGDIKEIDPALAVQARDFLLQDMVVQATVDAWGRMIFKQHNELKRIS